jgi:hypothetical protein
LEGSGPEVIEVYAGISLEGFEKTTKNICQDVDLREKKRQDGEKSHKEELHNLHNSQSVRHVACIGERRNAYKILVAEPSEKKGVGVNGRMLLLDRMDTVVRVRTGFIWLRIGSSGELL